MSAIVDHARSMLAYNRWANEKILAAAAGLSPEAFATISDTLGHTVGTQFHWNSNWTGRQETEQGLGLSSQQINVLFNRSHGELDDLAKTLTDEEWHRMEAWWSRFGVEAKAPLGMTLFQVIYHGIQHRAEVAVALTEHGCSPGDLDYLVFLRETVVAG